MWCMYCKKKGHTTNECRKIKADKEEKNKKAEPKEGEHAKVVVADTSAADIDHLYQLFMANSGSRSDFATKWIVNSGASVHMTSQRRWFINYRPLPTPFQVRLGDERAINAIGVGRVGANLHVNGTTSLFIFSDVYYVPDLNGNLLSVAHLTTKGFNVEFKDNTCRILRSSKLVGFTPRFNSLYILDSIPISPPRAYVTSVGNSPLISLPSAFALKAHAKPVSKADLTTWHCRLGHINVDYVLKMTHQGMVKGMDIVGDISRHHAVCVPCLEGKQSRLPISKEAGSKST